MAGSPLDQFKIHKLVPIEVAGFDVSLTNASICMIAVTLTIILFQHFALRRPEVVPSRLQVMIESSYTFITNMIDDNIGREGRVYAPFIFGLFTFLVFANLFGMLPYGFTITSHLAVTSVLAGVFFTAITIIGFARHGLHFLHLFLPEGVPKLLAPFIFILELFAYLVRPITLALRLFLNMTAGHIMLKVFAGFSVMMGATFAIFPALFNVIFVGFEFFVAILQAYIFTILTCIYLNDAINLH